VKYQSGQPVADAEVQVTLQEKMSQSAAEVKKLVTDASGIITFTIAPMKSNSTFTLSTKVR
jgi:5-hydroxyisourate hydrolase-like protein (transthyretin family)